MPGKGKGKARGKSRGKDRRKKHGKRDPLRLQIAVKITRPTGRLRDARGRFRSGLSVTRELIDAAVEDFCMTGNQDPAPGINISAVRWFNYYRKNAGLAVEKEATDPSGIAEAHETLHLRELLLKKGIGFFNVRIDKGVRAK